MKFKLNIDCDNAAFDDESGFGLSEISRILGVVSDYLANLDLSCCTGESSGMDDYIKDINGNRVGRWSIVKD